MRGGAPPLAPPAQARANCADRSPADSRGETTGRALEPWGPRLRTWLRPRPARRAGARPWGPVPRAVSAPAQSASTLASPTAIAAGASMSEGA